MRSKKKRKDRREATKKDKRRGKGDVKYKRKEKRSTYEITVQWF